MIFIHNDIFFKNTGNNILKFFVWWFCERCEKKEFFFSGLC